MASFINEVLQDLKERDLDFSGLTFILPSKRAGLFLKNEVPNIIEHTIFSPEILSIEEFVENLSDLKLVSNIEILFEFYSIYTQNTDDDHIDSFDSFSKWAQILIQDFNEIDRYLVQQDKIFDYLSAIKDVEHWSLQENQSDIVKNYLSFWKRLKVYYNKLSDHLKLNKKGYQGLIYREAVNNVENYIQSHNKHHVFIGFNALNSCEEIIIQELLQNNLASIYWDADEHYAESKIHDAGLFIRNHKSNWNYFNHNDFNWIANNFSKNKNIEVVGIPKNIGQAKYIGNILDNFSKNKMPYNKTAVVLGDEILLIPVINALPKSVEAINITMGLPLKSIPLSSLFESLFQLHKTKSGNSIYNKEVVSILSHQFVRPLLNGFCNTIIEDIQDNNLIYVPIQRIKNLAPEHKKLIDLLLGDWENEVSKALNNCLTLILHLKAYYSSNKSEFLLNLEYLYRFNEIFNQLKVLISKNDHIKDIKTLYGLYKEILNNESLDFRGEPLQGLQLMGMLESRVLDFDNVIISSVNEGILPAGKSHNSFIPFDVKLENKLPTFKEKDAVYSYHFFRLLQRAKNIFILYNTEPDAFSGGEKSRFVTQLEIEGVHKIKQKLVSPLVPSINHHPIVIEKSETVTSRIQDIANKGFSPSSLTNYMRNPIDFYYQKILKINPYEDIEETVALNTLGTVVHDTLEEFYKPFQNKFLKIEDLKILKPKIAKTVEYYFKKIYKEGDLKNGKNLIIFEIAKRYVRNLLNLDIEDLKKGNRIRILKIESEENRVKLDIPELDFPVYLNGKVDRVDEYNGVTRIIDYKTGKVEQSKVEIVNWEDLNSDYNKYSKPHQVLAYAYMMNSQEPFDKPVEAGIISFKNLNHGFLKFAKKDKLGTYAKKETYITQDTLDNYFIQLKKLILEICNPEVDFIEKEL